MLKVKAFLVFLITSLFIQQTFAGVVSDHCEQDQMMQSSTHPVLAEMPVDHHNHTEHASSSANTKAHQTCDKCNSENCACYDFCSCYRVSNIYNLIPNDQYNTLSADHPGRIVLNDFKLQPGNYLNLFKPPITC